MKKLFKRTLWTLLVMAAALGVAAVVSHKSLPDNGQRTASQWLPPDASSALAAHMMPLAAQHPGDSGVYPFADGVDAFAARLSLAEAARHTLDVQYYIWRDDASGRLLTQSLYRAAERGVRVRLLLDDNNTKGQDALLLALDRHPHIEVRLFNPFMQRRHRILGYLSDFDRLNRRMHNKSFSADGAVSIVGGRNVGDEYFGAGDGVLFADLDVAVTGPAVEAVGRDFDRYWHSESAYPAERILDPTLAPAVLTGAPAQDPQTQAYLKRLAASDFARRLQQGQLELTWAPARLVSDDPAKGLGKARAADTVLAQIAPLMEGAQKQLLIVSPYFVPTRQGSDMLEAIAARGTQLVVLTNSLAATDVSAVHSGYAKYRKDLLRAGVQLHELKPEATITQAEKGAMRGSSGASLHAKTFSVDGTQLFVGSFNMDPRSAALNTELGLIFDSPSLAGLLDAGMRQHAAEHTYAVHLRPDGRLQWQTQVNGQPQTLDTEPQTTWFKRAAIWLMAQLPIEWML